MEKADNISILLSANEFEKYSMETSQRVLEWGLLVYQYYTPLLVIFGIIGNSLSVLVFLLDLKYIKKSSSHYLTALAISDSSYLLNLFCVWLGSLTNGVITSPFTCPLVMYLGQVTCFVTVYITVAFTLERYIAVYFPFRKLQYCTASKAKKVIFGIVAIALLAFPYVWLIAEVAVVEQETNEPTYICSVAYKYHNISEIANYLDTLFTFIVPIIVITCFNAKIILKLYQRKANGTTLSSVVHRLESMAGRRIILPQLQQRIRDVIQVIYIPIAYTDGLQVKRGYSRRSPRMQQLKSKISEIRATKILFLISVVFICLHLPLHLLRCAIFIQHTTQVNIDEMKILIALQPWAMILFNTNFAVNFLLYCVSGTRFRKSLRNMIGRIYFTSIFMVSRN